MNWLQRLFHPDQAKAAHNSGQAVYHAAVFYPVGAENQVYQPAPPVVPAMLPVVWYGANGITAGHAPSPIQLPQLYAQQTGFIAGVGGPLSGQIVMGPLNIPETTNGSQ
jgi:hypothetical protein